MNQYKKWTGKERQKSLRLTNEAIKRGLIEKPHRCQFCGQEKGVLHLHNSNYDVTLEYVRKMLLGTATKSEISLVKSVLWPICWRCHMMLHSEHRNPDAVKRYFEEVKNGKQYPPVYFPNSKASNKTALMATTTEQQLSLS